MPPPTKTRIFISYSRESANHTSRVRALADRLRTDGIESWIDQYVQDPNEGWIRWMRSQVKEADRVLLVFAETYQRRFEGDEEEGKRPVRAASDKPRGDALQFWHAKSEHMLIKLWLSLIEPRELKA
jgi:hypothetical protein